MRWHISASGVNAKCGAAMEGKPDAKTGVQAPYLSPGFSDFDDGHDAFASMGVGLVIWVEVFCGVHDEYFGTCV